MSPVIHRSLGSGLRKDCAAVDSLVYVAYCQGRCVGAGDPNYYVSYRAGQCRSQTFVCTMIGLPVSALELGGPKIYVSFVLFFSFFVAVSGVSIAGIWIHLVF